MSPAPRSTSSRRSRPRTTRSSALENVVCTPHLGAATAEAQENVALQVAEQMADYLLTGAVTNALNMPSVTAEEAPRLRPYMELAEQLGSFAGQLTATQTASRRVTVEYEGHVAELNTRPLTARRWRALLRAAARQRQHGQRPGDRAGARHRGRGDQARAGQRLSDADPRDRRYRRSGRGRSTGTLFGGEKPRLVGSRASRSRPRFRSRHAVHHATRTSPASSAISAPRWARRASTSRPSTWAARRPARTR